MEGAPKLFLKNTAFIAWNIVFISSNSTRQVCRFGCDTYNMCYLMCILMYNAYYSRTSSTIRNFLERFRKHVADRFYRNVFWLFLRNYVPGSYDIFTISMAVHAETNRNVLSDLFYKKKKPRWHLPARRNVGDIHDFPPRTYFAPDSAAAAAAFGRTVGPQRRARCAAVRLLIFTTGRDSTSRQNTIRIYAVPANRVESNSVCYSIEIHWYIITSRSQFVGRVPWTEVTHRQ